MQNSDPFNDHFVAVPIVFHWLFSDGLKQSLFKKRQKYSGSLEWYTNKCDDTCHVALDENVCFTSADHNRLSGKSRSQFLFWSFICVHLYEYYEWNVSPDPSGGTDWWKYSRFQIKTVDVSLKSWKSLLIFTIFAEDSSPIPSLAPWISCLTLRFLPVSFHEVNYPGSLQDCTVAALLLVWINTAKVRLQKFFVQWSHHWRCYFLFCFSVNLSHSRHHLRRFTGYRCAVYVIS